MAYYFVIDEHLELSSASQECCKDFNITGITPGMNLRQFDADLSAALLRQLQVLQLSEVDNTCDEIRLLGTVKHAAIHEERVFQVWTHAGPERKQYLVSRILVDGIEEEAIDKLDIQEIRRFRAVMELASIGVLQLDSRYQCIYASSAWVELSGIDQMEANGRGWVDSIHSAERADFLDILVHKLEPGKTVDTTVRLQNPLGSVIWVSVQGKALYTGGGGFDGMVLTFIDITAKHDAEQQLRTLATNDVLTGLLNRYAFQRELNEAVMSWRPGREFALMFIDLDGFKAVNDVYGHAIGDMLLKEVARRLKKALRSDDKISRTGGDEFAILLRQISEPMHLEHAAQKILDILERPYRLSNNMEESYISASIGIAQSNLHEERDEDVFTDEAADAYAERLMSRADVAMYRAKAAGRKSFRFYEQSLDDEARETMAMSNAVHRIMDNSSFEIAYQPQYNIHGTQLQGYEALLRWPGNDSISPSPGKFIPLLESKGLMGELGQWVIRAALADHAEILGRCSTSTFLPSVSINLSAVQFRDGTLAWQLKREIESAGVPPESVVIEITESVLMDSYAEIDEQLADLRSFGIRIALDDFGTGYSSLSYLHRFAIDIIKIDKSFIQSIDQPDARRIVHAIINLALSLNKGVIAEGVESLEQVRILEQENCPSIQGWLFAKAMPYRDIIRLLSDMIPIAS